MINLHSVVSLFVYVVVVCPVVWCHAPGDRSHVTPRQEHVHKQEPPCAVCPRTGKCVHKIQCPAHVRTSSQNPTCHLGDTVGVCCFTGSHHAAENDHKFRSTTTLTPEDVKASHLLSHKKLSEWTIREQRLLDHPHTVVNTTAPSYGHHLSLVTYDKRAAKLARGALLNLFAAQDLKARQAISDQELELDLTGDTDGPFCSPPPICQQNSRYRSIEGDCNNPEHPSWGAVHTGFERLLPPDYSDGIWSMRVAKSGLQLPSARTVSSTLLLDGSHPSTTHSMLFMQFGQFLAHDISAAQVFTAGNGSAISCCLNDGQATLPPELQHFACAPIPVPPEDPFFGQFGHTCHNFVRAMLAQDPDCSVGYAKQMNGATHYLDLSHLYGNSLEKLTTLRAPGGLLNTFNDYGRELPPLTQREECVSMKGSACFESGDHHGNQIISLTVLHTIFTREHNRIAKTLSTLNPLWSEDTLFYETRRIVQAELQHIVYNEWLPLLLGPDLMKSFNLSPVPGYASSYDPGTNPSLTVEFSTAAMRFGHSTVDGKIVVPSSATGDVYETISIPEVMFQPTRMRLRHFLDRLLIGLSSQPMQNVDPFITEGLTRYMFHGGNPYGIDLASINIQRGRDYGVRSYNDYRRLIGLQPFIDFQEFVPSVSKRLSSVYGHTEDIDLYIGGLLEEPVDGGLLGPTFANIIADQFSRLKNGDKYYYEYGPDVNPAAFLPGQLEEIKKVTLSRIICDNRDGIELFSQAPAAFLIADLNNQPVPCDSIIIPAMDLNRFKES